MNIGGISVCVGGVNVFIDLLTTDHEYCYGVNLFITVFMEER